VSDADSSGPWLDVSVSLDRPFPRWPSSSGVSVSWASNIDAGDAVRETNLALDVHCGTHVDAPSHVLRDGASVGDLPLEAFLGPVLVVDATGRSVVDAALIEAAVPAGTARVLFRTDNSATAAMRRPEFDAGFVGLSVEAAAALARRPELLLVGNDYLSIQPYGGDDETHRVLLRRGIAVLEGLDLTDVRPGPYELVAPPLRIDGAEGSPVRALLRGLAAQGGTIMPGADRADGAS
jgi:arylformamidase